MTARCFIAYAADTSALTAPPALVASGTTGWVSKTILQVCPQPPGAVRAIKVIEWGYTFYQLQSGGPFEFDLCAVNALATMASTPSGMVRPYNNAGNESTFVQLGPGWSGFNASAEGSLGGANSSIQLAFQWEMGPNQNFKQPFPQGREPEVPSGWYLRIRAAPYENAAINVQCYVIWEE